MKALEIYKPPFISDGNFIWSSNDVMSLMLADHFSNEEEVLSELAKILNGEDKPTKARKYEYNAPEILHNGEPLFVVRGWGHLTGSGAMNLEPEVAAKIQDEFAQWVIEKLTLQ